MGIRLQGAGRVWEAGSGEVSELVSASVLEWEWELVWAGSELSISRTETDLL